MKRPMTRDRANRINWKRSDKEHNVVFPSMFRDLKSLKLKRISTFTGDRNNHKTEELKADKLYLVGYDGRWFISRAYASIDESWYFNLHHYNMGIGMIDFVFETNLEDYDGEPLGRVSYKDDDEY